MWYFLIRAFFLTSSSLASLSIRLLLVRLGCVLVCRCDLAGLALLRRVALGRVGRCEVRVAYAFAAVDGVQRRDVCATDHGQAERAGLDFTFRIWRGEMSAMCYFV